MMLGNEIEHLFSKMDYELGEEFMRTRLKQSVHEMGPWQRWFHMLRESDVRQDEWIAQLDPSECAKGIASLTGKMK
jgi:hypothetical protein